MTNIKEIKKLIRQLRKIKKDTPKKTHTRRDINAKIRELKKQLQDIRGNEIATPEKQILIEEIYRLTPYLKDLRGFDLTQYSIEQLEKHITNIRRGK